MVLFCWIWKETQNHFKRIHQISIWYPDKMPMPYEISFGYKSKTCFKENIYCNYHICFKSIASKNEREIEHYYALFLQCHWFWHALKRLFKFFGCLGISQNYILLKASRLLTKDYKVDLVLYKVIPLRCNNDLHIRLNQVTVNSIV